VNGSIRSVFDQPSTYIGLDWRPGPSVDKVCLAHDMSFEHKFSTIVSASALEHDPYWNRSTTKMVEYLDPEGILIITCGGAREKAHELHTAPDGKFHTRPAQQLLNHLETLGVYIHEFMYETHFSEGKNSEICVIGFLNPANAVGARLIDHFLPEDEFKS